ncbi:alpha-D-glucose phosphate-specific phosphoglucomutase [Yoonia sp. F2084L]|uniref:alpha-D-glucose phosphate-specific phosphoglucomutase n=1 Tax=Yoonia sp. F2084L TaxID=2926419 RepID=UPI001FF13258|nr:alpha-D-glucose phosphate-specific phosphoglucomutase [Yoonia sp. F2084L]MCK0094959.1 alpha-D-glucose phosphate-specific phosphoglucomutase [Yoonia sp. F2084L]
MTARRIATQAIPGQQAGTSGLRRKTRDFMAPHFLENYVQATLNGIGGAAGKRLVVGGDGRYFNPEAIQVILRMAAANGVAEVIVGRDGLLSTPAASHLIRLNKTDGGFILSASHNPGGIDADFGIKFNMANGGPASQTLADAIYDETQTIADYGMFDAHDIALHETGTRQLGDMTITVVDPVADYAALMAELFDFNAIAKLFAGGFGMCFDAMHAVTGPYAHKILEDMLGAPKGTVINGIPLPDFGKGHPDPNPIWAHELMGIMTGPDAPDFGAASDGDGDRNMIVGRGAYVTPSDSLALIAAHAHLAPGYAQGLSGVARSMPTSTAVDRVAAAKGMACFETPTGWKFFGTLLDAGKANLCGEESAGTGSDHVREKDGLWAVLMWLNIIAVSGKSVSALMQDHWQNYGRNYYSRHDYEAIDINVANRLVSDLKAKLDSLPGQSFAGLDVTEASDFSYRDPVDHSFVEGQGIQIKFAGDARVVLRLSGTGTEGATLRVYLEQLETDAARLNQTPEDALAAVKQAADEIAEITARTGRDAPDVKT